MSGTHRGAVRVQAPGTGVVTLHPAPVRHAAARVAGLRSAEVGVQLGAMQVAVGPGPAQGAAIARRAIPEPLRFGLAAHAGRDEPHLGVAHGAGTMTIAQVQPWGAWKGVRGGWRRWIFMAIV